MSKRDPGGTTLPCPECGGGSDEYYNTPGKLRDAPCPRCGGSGNVPADPGGETWLIVVVGFILIPLYYIFVYPFVWLWSKLSGRPMD